MSKFKAPKCQMCGLSQRASSQLQWKKGNYACHCNSVDYNKATKYRREHPLNSEICTELAEDEEVKLVVLGAPAIKKNSPRITKMGKTVSIRPSLLYEIWAARAIKQLQEQWILLGRTGISGPVWMEAHYYRDTIRRCDLSNLHEGIQDCMTTVGVYLDDSQIESHDRSRKHQDKNEQNPRIEVTLRRFKE